MTIDTASHHLLSDAKEACEETTTDDHSPLGKWSMLDETQTDAPSTIAALDNRESSVSRV